MTNRKLTNIFCWVFFLLFSGSCGYGIYTRDENASNLGLFFFFLYILASPGGSGD